MATTTSADMPRDALDAVDGLGMCWIMDAVICCGLLWSVVVICV